MKEGKLAAARLAHIDWMRGLACLLMFQTHCYDSWLGGEARSGRFFRGSQLLGTLPAPLFLFLAGISFALVTDKLRRRGLPGDAIARTTIRRGAEIYALGMLFRVQEYVLGLPGAPWTDLLRVDILNMIGLSMMLMGVACRLTPTRTANAVFAALIALAIALATPPLWTTWRPFATAKLPWFLESYVNGVHTFAEPQPWLFPIFPWTGFAFAGLAVGLLVMSERARQREPLVFAGLGAAGLALAALAWTLDSLPMRLYAVYDYWHSSPNFFLLRVGVLLMILSATYAWCRWGAGQWGFSPMIQLGLTSLLVYWVHIEFVYGRFAILPKRASSIASASAGLFTIFVAMLLLSLARTRLKGRGAEALMRLRRAVGASEG